MNVFVLLTTNGSCHDRGHACARGVPDIVPSNLKWPKQISTVQQFLLCTFSWYLFLPGYHRLNRIIIKLFFIVANTLQLKPQLRHLT